MECHSKKWCIIILCIILCISILFGCQQKSEYQKVQNSPSSTILYEKTQDNVESDSIIQDENLTNDDIYEQIEIQQNTILDLVDKENDLAEIGEQYLLYCNYMSEDELEQYDNLFMQESQKNEIDKSVFNAVFINANLRQQVVETALSYLGTPYVWGGASESGFDCSGFVMYVYESFDVFLSHYTVDQYNEGINVDYNDLLPGDAVFFGSGLSHVGIYIGNDQYVHSPHTGDVVKISYVSDRSDFVGGARYIY